MRYVSITLVAVLFITIFLATVFKAQGGITQPLPIPKLKPDQAQCFLPWREQLASTNSLSDEDRRSLENQLAAAEAQCLMIYDCALNALDKQECEKLW